MLRVKSRALYVRQVLSWSYIPIAIFYIQILALASQYFNIKVYKN